MSALDPEDLRAELRARLNEQVAAAAARQRARAQTRAVFAARRTAGLRARHATKENRARMKTPTTVAVNAWGPWTLNRSTRDLSIDLHDPYSGTYTINLDQMYSSAEMLDFICQVAAKEWANATITAGLIRALIDIFQPQANLCPWGSDRRLTTTDVQRLIDQYRPGNR